jgi:hypothetical protein
MTRSSVTTFGLLSALVVITPRLAVAQDTEDAERDAHRAKTKALATSLQIYATADRTQAPLPLSDEPVLRYTDSTRKTHESALWVWGQGRPAAVMAIEYYPGNQGKSRWLYEIASLSADRISAKRGDDLDWNANAPGLELKDIPEAPAPEESAAGRLIQIRQIQRRFTAFDYSAARGRLELRPLTRPLHRYSDSDQHVIDGAIVAFANGTNPEVLLTLEAVENTGDRPQWRFSLAQMTGEEVTVLLDGKEIWQGGCAEAPATKDSYINGWLDADE